MLQLLVVVEAPLGMKKIGRIRTLATKALSQFHCSCLPMRNPIPQSSGIPSYMVAYFHLICGKTKICILFQIGCKHVNHEYVECFL
jgi:hypothetical protein